MLRILLADDHPILRSGLRTLLEARGMTVVGEASNGHDAIQGVRTLAPDIAILDIGMPGLNGADTARQLAREAPHVKVILLTVHSDDAYVVEALRAGVKGYVLKSQATEDLLEAIEAVLAGAVYLSPTLAPVTLERLTTGTTARGQVLTPREREVLQLIAEGHTTKEVGSVLGISAKTAETHRTRIMLKLDVHETAGLVRHAVRIGLVQA